MAAINIAGWAKLNNLLNSLARQLKNILDKSSDQAAVRSLIASCSNSYFDEPTYMDLVDFSTSLLSQISALQLETLLAQKLENTLNAIINSVKNHRDCQCYQQRSEQRAWAFNLFTPTIIRTLIWPNLFCAK